MDGGMKTQIEASRFVLDRYNGDIEAANRWWAAPSEMLGGLSPNDMLRMGREKKLFQLMEDEIAGNVP